MKGVMIEEKTFFFRTGDKPLYGKIYRSSDAGVFDTAPDKTTRRGLVICDSLFEEKFWCERVFSNLGRHLAEKCITVFTFDYHGYGNSSGASEDVTVESMVRDIDAACDLLRGEGIDHISLLGIRWGAALAGLAASSRTDVDSLFLVNPVKKWKSQLMKALRSNVAGQYSIFKKTIMTRDKIIEELLSGGDCMRSGYHMNNIEGYILTKEFYEQASKVDFPTELPEHIRSVTVFTIPEKHTSAEVKADPLVEEFCSGGVDCEGVVITEDNAFWVNNRIFTSDTPVFFKEMENRLLALRPAKVAKGQPVQDEAGPKESCVVGRVRETAVTISSTGGHDLCAVLYEPSGEPRKKGFVFTHGGMIGLNGAFRFNTRAARKMAEIGYPCICCDTHGMGRSTGKMENQEQRILFRKICTGLFASDVENATGYLKDKTRVEKAVLFGVCGGAITNIFAHSYYKNVDESIILSVPVMLPSLEYGEVRMSEGYARFYLGLYMRKTFNPKAWWRFITGKSEMNKILKSVQVTVSSFLKRSSGKKSQVSEVKQPQQVRSGVSVAVPGVGDLQFNYAFLDAYRKIVKRRGRIYFIFGEHDNFKWEFNKEFVDVMPDEFSAGRDYIKVEEITHANHMYTLREWQDIIIDKCIEWVETGN